eukprot:m.223844 g.223844  ORF g.223844 m.223844 type:complete len:240 (-) comp15142_c0_seq2:195-914(-)
MDVRADPECWECDTHDEHVKHLRRMEVRQSVQEEIDDIRRQERESSRKIADYQPEDASASSVSLVEEATACCVTERQDKVLTYRVELDGEPVVAMIDSGASRSMVPGFGKRSKRALSTPLELTLADGSKTRLRWESLCQVKYPNGSQEEIWVVVGPTGGYPLLFAHDWMQRKSVVVAYDKGVPSITLGAKQDHEDHAVDLAEAAKAKFPEVFEPPSMESARKMPVVHELKLKKDATFTK